MSAPLYNADILRLATCIPHHQRLTAPQTTAERRSPVCGSRIIVDVSLAPDGRILALGQEVRACALGQAAASLMGAHALGMELRDIEAARDALADFLAGKSDDPGAWPGLEIFAPARPHVARHPSIRLPFEALAEAVAQALQGHDL